MLIAALLFGLPIFFDAGLVVYALPAAGGFAAMHAIVPPTVGVLGKVHVPIDDSVLTGGREPDEGERPAFVHVLGYCCSR